MTQTTTDVSAAMEENTNTNNNGTTMKSNEDTNPMNQNQDQKNNEDTNPMNQNQNQNQNQDQKNNKDTNPMNQNQNENENQDQDQKKNRIQVSNTKKPLFFYLNLAKRYLKQHDEVELSALGMAIPTVVIIAEILKRNGIASDQKVMISTVGNNDESNGRLVRKARIEIILEKPKNTTT